METVKAVKSNGKAACCFSEKMMLSSKRENFKRFQGVLKVSSQRDKNPFFIASTGEAMAELKGEKKIVRKLFCFHFYLFGFLLIVLQSKEKR